MFRFILFFRVSCLWIVLGLLGRRGKSFSHLTPATRDHVISSSTSQPYTRELTQTSGNILNPRTGCLTCKRRHKKCDEVKPKCIRCQKSGLECSGYTYIQGKNKKVKKMRTLPAPRERKDKTRVQDHRAVSPSMEIYTFGAAHNAAGSMEPLDDLFGFTFVSTPFESLGCLDSWPHTIHESTSSEPHVMFNSNLDQHGVLPTSSVTLSPPTSNSSTSLTAGQASLLSALFSLGDSSPDSFVSPSNTIYLDNEATPSLLNEPTWSSPDTRVEDSCDEEEDPEGVSQIICRPLVLDKNAGSNALPFILQNYATWIARMAYEPLKMALPVRDFVVQQFEDGQESRFILTLLANIGGQLGRGVLINGTHLSIISTLQGQVRRRLASVKMIGDDKVGRRESIKALDATLETIVVHFFIGPTSEWLTLRNEAAPLFQRLCPEPAGSPVNLPSLLQRPDVCLRRYIHLDVLSATLMDIPMLFRYDCTPQSTQPTCELRGDIQTDRGTQWFHGTPERFVAIFAKINTMREEGWTPTPEIVSVFERGIQDFKPAQDSSCDSFLSVMRLVVQECWRQVAYVYLYMGLCRDSSNTPRVQRALKQFMKLLDGTKPGRMPDEFLIMNIILIAPAAQKQSDREIIRKRIDGLRITGRSQGIKDNINIMEDYWARADAEGRDIMWSDIAQARRRVVGI
ncbi:hypothetical protein ACGC1H_002043 [Rhizoctonia solani]